MNQIILSGRLTADPALKFTQSGTAVATGSIAVDRRFSKEKETDFFNFVAWGKTGEFMSERVAKGNRVILQGRLQTRSYEAKDGTKRYVTEIVVEQVEPIDWAERNEQKLNVDMFSDMTPVDDKGLPFQEGIKMKCKKCGSEHVLVQKVSETKTKKKRTWKYWLFFGWAVDLFSTIFFGIFYLIPRLLFRRKPKVETVTHTEAVCQSCGKSWRV